MPSAKLEVMPLVLPPFDPESPAVRAEAARYAEIFGCHASDVVACLLRARGNRKAALEDLRDRLTARGIMRGGGAIFGLRSDTSRPSPGPKKG